MKKRFMRFIGALLIPAFLFQALGAGSEYYDHTTYPSQGAAGSSAAMRAELDLIESGFGKLPALSGNGGKVVGVNSGGTALEALTTTGTGSGVRATSPTLVTPTIGVATATSVNKVTITAPATSATLTLSNGSTLATSGGHSLTLTTTGSTNVTLPTSGTLLSSTGSVSNLLGGAAGKIPYQSAADTTGFTAAGSSSEVLLSGGTGSPTWAAQSTLAVGSATTATNLASGSAGAIPYQSGAGATGFSAAGTSGQVVLSGGTGAPTFAYKSERIQPIDYSLAGNALTLKLNPTTLDFRSTTLTSGDVTTVSNASQITTTISSGSTGGTVNAVQSDIIILAINNAGTMELAWTNMSGGTDLSETGLISTTAEGGAGAADSGTTIYSTTARTNVAYRVVGLVRSTQATAGTWATAPVLIQGAGGNALAALSSYGYGQTFQDLTSSRAASTTYYNTTGKMIDVYVYGTISTGTGTAISVTVNGFVVYAVGTPSAGLINLPASFRVPPGGSYSVEVTNLTITKWFEFR